MAYELYIGFLLMDILDSIPKNGMKFNLEGTPIDPELRPLWRISLIVLILVKLCSGNKANPKKVQVLYSLVSSEKKRLAYIDKTNKSKRKYSINVRFDPLVDRAIDIGIGNNMFELDEAKSVKLTSLGLSYGKKIEKDTNIFILEKAFMSQFKKSYFNDKIINSLLSGDLL